MESLVLVTISPSIRPADPRYQFLDLVYIRSEEVIAKYLTTVICSVSVIVVYIRERFNEDSYL